MWRLHAYWSEKLGLTFDGRGNYGTAFVGLNEASVTRPAISHYDVLVGPTYRFRMRPRYSIAGSVKGGVAISNFASDTNKFGTAVLGLYPDGTTYAINASLIGEVNVTPNLSLRLAPEYIVNRIRIDAAKRPRVHVWLCLPVWKVIKSCDQGLGLGIRKNASPMFGEASLFGRVLAA